MAERQNDWVIEDSEEEDQLCATEPNPVPPAAAAEDGVSSIQAFTPTVAESAQETSHISSLDCAPSAQHIVPSIPPQAEHSTISEFSTKSSSKPRPRPIFGHPNTGPVANTSTSDPILSHTPASDRREQPTLVAHSDPTGIQSVGENTAFAPIDFSQDIAERAKMRTRKAAKRPMRPIEDIIDITDDELAITPARKPRERPKPRPVKRATTNRDHPPLPSDPATIPVPSSSMSLPPSDPFPESIVINSPPPPGRDEAAASASSPRESPVRKRKRNRQGRLQSPIDEPTHPDPFSAAPGRASSPLSDPPPLVRTAGTTPDVGHDVKSNAKDSDDEHSAEESTKKHKNAKGSTSASPGKSEFKKKSIVEVVILSPKKKNKRTEASGEDKKPRKGPKSRNKRPASSDEDGELLLAPQTNSSTVVKSHKGKKRATKPRSEDSRPSIDVASSSTGIATGEEQQDHRQGAAPMPHTDVHDKNMSLSVKHTTATPLKENALPSVSVGGKDPPQSSSPTRETPNRGKLRYTLSSLDRKTPMQELIRRAASHPHTPFSTTSSPIASPLAKTSKSALRRIAPLHLTRRTPPPPPPPPPPPKKSKKMLQLEEKWELELEDEVEGWWALTDEERRDWRKAKRDKELGYDD